MAQLSLFEVGRRLPGSIGPATVSSKPKSKVLVPGRGRIDSYDYTLNPYIGCSFGCSYCFAASFVADENRRDAWGKWVDVKEGAVGEVSRANLRGKKIFMSASTDPYQPIEAQVCLTRDIVEVLARKQARLTVQTRSPLVTRDCDVFARFNRVRVNMSVTTDCDDVRRSFEPSCASIERRLAALEEVAKHGIPIAVCIAPMLPIRDPVAFARRIHALNPEAVSTAWFHQSQRAFASNTRAGAIEIARSIGWTRREYEKAVAAMRPHLPQLGPSLEAFEPA